MRASFHFSWFCLMVAMVFTGCSGQKSEDPAESGKENVAVTPEVKRVAAPVFNADSAFAFVKRQVDFGPRVPGSKAHAACHDYLVGELKRFGFEVTLNQGKARTYDKKEHNVKNIIGSLHPSKGNRILLCAHYDTRPVADRDTKDREKPIDGANDGASGVGVLLEIARVISADSSAPGVDIVFFDIEDYGAPKDAPSVNEDENWCLGSQYWTKNPHKPGYTASYGILLDMVGAKGSVFPVEATSDYMASWVVKKVWDNSARLGFSNFFVQGKFGPITDDHLYINQNLHIPTIDIISWNLQEGDFGKFHHTHEDNMSIIDPQTLKAVGQTVLETIYN